jgi:hypothetical protein
MYPNFNFAPFDGYNMRDDFRAVIAPVPWRRDLGDANTLANLRPYQPTAPDLQAGPVLRPDATNGRTRQLETPSDHFIYRSGATVPASPAQADAYNAFIQQLVQHERVLYQYSKDKPHNYERVCSAMANGCMLTGTRFTTHSLTTWTRTGAI